MRKERLIRNLNRHDPCISYQSIGRKGWIEMIRRINGKRAGSLRVSEAKVRLGFLKLGKFPFSN